MKKKMFNFIRIFSYSSELKMMLNIFLNLVLGSSFLGLDDVLHLFSLSFVGGVTDDFSDNIMNESGFLGFLAFVSALAVLVASEFGDFVAFVWADDHSHVFSVSHVVLDLKKINFCKFDLRL